MHEQFQAFPLPDPRMHAQFQPLGAALNQLWAVLKAAGVKEMPRLVFDRGDDWIAATAILPPETLLADRGFMHAGFRFDIAAKPINEADRFVAQEIGA